MKFIDLNGVGGPEILVPQQQEIPSPEEGEVLIKVGSAGINRPDVMQREGKYAPPPGASTIPGLEVSGTVMEMGSGVSEYKIGDHVCALVSGGGYAEYCLAPSPQTLPIPDGIPMLEAGGIPETFFTVWTNVFQRGKFKAGDSILIHGGSSGIGTTAIQLVREFGAKEIFVTASSEEKLNACKDLGATHLINYKNENFEAVIAEQTSGRGIDIILDMVGGDYVQKNINCLSLEGRLVQIAFQRSPVNELNLLPMMVNRLTITGSTLRPRTIDQKGAIAIKLKTHVWPLLSSRKIKVLIDSTFPLEEASKAHALMDTSKHIGKILLTTAHLE
jgi:putative PIG3 family NAD(P)H quinone oxidoreductase